MHEHKMDELGRTTGGKWRIWGRLVGQEVDRSIRLHFISGSEVLQNNEGLVLIVVFFCKT
jgi:hypothetical protein